MVMTPDECVGTGHCLETQVESCEVTGAGASHETLRDAVNTKLFGRLKSYGGCPVIFIPIQVCLFMSVSS